ncbi:hypothetical protein [Chroococcus sp. FPU101]|uniref:hypothetical protein n=1 Tax=Chroococcus sp. FPU101 TaxID=1974212 RepID=UPI001A8C9238|nr:hypothetical protein [Chroococcus sp. FPU101]GFE72028.1 hypothetical protein CFPU101_46380 [Chroococcus sp. FPU101]
MSNFPEQKIEEWLFLSKKRITVGEFCSRWVPIIYQISPEDRRYSAACLDLLERITQRKAKTIYAWMAGTISTPRDIENLLGLCDYLFKIQQSLDLS